MPSRPSFIPFFPSPTSRPVLHFGSWKGGHTQARRHVIVAQTREPYSSLPSAPPVPKPPPQPGGKSPRPINGSFGPPTCRPPSPVGAPRPPTRESLAACHNLPSPASPASSRPPPAHGDASPTVCAGIQSGWLVDVSAGAAGSGVAPPFGGANSSRDAGSRLVFLRVGLERGRARAAEGSFAGAGFRWVRSSHVDGRERLVSGRHIRVAYGGTNTRGCAREGKGDAGVACDSDGDLCCVRFVQHALPLDVVLRGKRAETGRFGRFWEGMDPCVTSF